MHSRLRHSILLAALLAVALFLRLWYSSDDPSAARIYDERFAIENIVAIARSGSLEPANGYHPALSYLPDVVVVAAADRLHRAFGWPAESPLRERDLTATGYRLGRALHALLGMLTVWLTVELGRRIFGPAAGLLGGLFVAAAPLHIRQSSIINEDVVLAVTVLLAALATLAALERPAARTFVRAGAAFGLALAAKFNGGVFSLPLAARALWDGWRGRRDRRQVLWLGLAAAGAVAVFLALNPYLPFRLELYQRDFGQTARLYDQRGARRGPWHVVVHVAQTMARPDLLGPVLGYLGLAALLVAALALVRRPAPPQRDRLYVLTSFPAVYVLALAIPAVYVTGHQWLPLLPFWAIAAAEAVVRSAVRLPAVARRLVPASIALVALLVVGRGVRFVHRSVVETPADCAAEFLARELAPGPAMVLSEVRLDGIRAPRLRGVMAVDPREGLAEAPPAALGVSDAVVFPRRRLAESGDLSPEFRAWLDGARSRNCAPGPFAGGEELVAAARRFESDRPGESVALAPDGGGVQVGSFESAQTGLVSYVLSVPRRRSRTTPTLRLDGETVPLVWLSASRGRNQYLSQRRVVAAGGHQIEIGIQIGVERGAPARARRADRAGQRPLLTLWRWRAPPVRNGARGDEPPIPRPAPER